ncbi:MAG: zeta toxin family protein [Ignavibacteria bacterium]|nr:zeta toxin family protein [Ignavibacteria bacterium]
MPDCHIIAGSNGAGKTTFAREFLTRQVHCLNFINPDLIAAGLSPFDASRAMLRAGRIVIEEIAARSAAGEDFAFETTLSGKTYLGTIDALRARGYRIHLYYLWIPSAELGLLRIRNRVQEGGHDVPEADVRRRFARTLGNVLHLYRYRVDSLRMYDNSTLEPRLLFSEANGVEAVYDPTLFARITNEAAR